MQINVRDKPKLKRVTRIDSIPAGSTSFDEQGFLHDTPIVTSTGIFEYALPDGGVRRELRLPEYVFEKASLASYAGKPVIITHNAGAIDKDNVMKEIVGTILSEGFRDGSDVRCKIVIHDIDKVKSTPYRELSLGYNLDLVEEPGEWNGEPYDAIQTNIRINHLAIVEDARAGDQAHLNLDGKKVGLDDRKIPEGGSNMEGNSTRNDGVTMTPEELVEAINNYKAANGGGAAADPAPAAEGDGTEKVPENPAASVSEAPAPATPVTPAPAETAPVQQEEKKDGGDIGALIEALEGLLAQLKATSGQGAETAPAADANDCNSGSEADGTECMAGGDEDNEDGADDLSGSMNNDSADEVFRQRLSICRMGDKLHMDGLEEKSIADGKKAIIQKVFPDMRLDGKSRSYLDAAYDLAVDSANKRKGVSYQKAQMTANPASQQRADGTTGSGAAAARQRMIEREGGNE